MDFIKNQVRDEEIFQYLEKRESASLMLLAAKHVLGKTVNSLDLCKALNGLWTLLVNHTSYTSILTKESSIGKSSYFGLIASICVCAFANSSNAL